MKTLRITMALMLCIGQQYICAQYVQLGNKLIGTGGEGNNGIGQSVAISADSSTVVAGSMYGGVFVYIYQAGQWVQQAHLTSSNCIGNCQLGMSVGISADGNTVIAGAAEDDSTRGAAFVFKRSGNTWAEEAKIVSTNVTGRARQGVSVGLSYNGNTAIIGACNDGDTLGAAFVYVRSGSTWSEQAKLVGTGAVRQSFQGYGVALSADGNIALSVSAVDSGSGAAWVFKRVGSVWQQDGPKLVSHVSGAYGNGSMGNNFMPRTVSLSGNGNRFTVGDPADQAIYLYEKVGGAWQLKQTINRIHDLSASPPSFGCYSALNYDGSALAASAYRDYNSGATYGYVYVFEDSAGLMYEKFYSYRLNGIAEPSGLKGVAISAGGKVVFGASSDMSSNGAAWVYTKQNGTWVQYGNKILAQTPARYVGLGASVAASADGNKIISAATSDNGGKGAFWTFKNNGGTYQQQGNKNTVGTGPDARFGENLSLSADGKDAVVINYAGWVWYNTKVGLWLYKDSANTWAQQNQVLKADSGRSYYWGGGGATISADGNTIVFSNTDAYSDSGAAWVFVKNGSTWVQQAVLRGDKGKGQAHKVALSADGNTVALSCHSDTFTYIFKRNAGMWQQDACLITTRSSSGLGSLTIAGDGNTIAVGRASDSSYNGKVYIYRSIGNAWLADGVISRPSDASSQSRFGISSALSADGNTLVAAASGDNGLPMNTGTGAFWQYRRSGNQWLQVGGKYVPNDAAGMAGFGTSLAMVPSTNKIVIGGTGDNNGQGAVWVFERTGLKLNTDTVINASCANTANGQIVLDVQDGAMPYQYKWSVPNAPNSNTLTNLSEGTYYVTVFDASGDSISTAIEVGVSNTSIQVSTAYKAQCGIGAEGWASISVQGGALPYQYLWSNNETDTLIENLAVGTYLYTVTDGNGCQIVNSITIPYTAFWSSAYSTPANCATNNGGATINPQGGTAPYTYIWSSNPQQTTANLMGVAAGNYTVTVADATGCSVTAKAEIDSICKGSITGVVYVDANNNCIQDLNENVLAGKPVAALGGGTAWHGTTNAQGVYAITVPNGTYSVRPYLGVAPGCGSVVACNTASTNVLVAGNDTIMNVDLAVNFANTYDLQANLIENGLPRPGSDVGYSISLSNNGIQQYTGTAVVTFTYGQPFQYVSSSITPTAIDVNTGTITWMLATVAAAGGITSIDVVLGIPPSAVIGSTYSHTVNISPTADDCNSDNNTDVHNNTIRGANDPNVKTCYPDSITHESDTVLTYTIQFQNNGNDTTRFITIKDTLSQYVDPASVRTVGASHAGYTFSVAGNGILTWYFDPIALPDSATDPVNSIGFVSYKVNTRGALPHGTVVDNRASIYFDYNEPVATNTHHNHVLLPTGLHNITAGPQVQVYPNPFNDATWFVINGAAGSCQFELKDATGKIVMQQKGIQANSFKIGRENLSAGVYIYTITDEQKLSAVGRVVVQ